MNQGSPIYPGVAEVTTRHERRAGGRSRLGWRPRAADGAAGERGGNQLDAFGDEAIVAEIRRDGRPYLSPNWFYQDGQRFCVSTTQDRVKYAIFRRDPRAQLLNYDPAGFPAVLVPGTVEIREDLAAELPGFRVVREKHSSRHLRR